MAKKRWVRFFMQDFQLAVFKHGLNLSEIGAYMLLLAECWDNVSCSLPDDNRMLQKLIGWNASNGDWRKVRGRFSAHPTEQGRLYNPRLYEEFLYCQDRSQKAAESGKRGGLAKAHKDASPQPQSVRPVGPVKPLHDREGKGFSSVGSELAKLADKVLPPIP